MARCYSHCWDIQHPPGFHWTGIFEKWVCSEGAQGCVLLSLCSINAVKALPWHRHKLCWNNYSALLWPFPLGNSFAERNSLPSLRDGSAVARAGNVWMPRLGMGAVLISLPALGELLPAQVNPVGLWHQPGHSWGFLEAARTIPSPEGLCRSREIKTPQAEPLLPIPRENKPGEALKCAFPRCVQYWHCSAESAGLW